MPGPHAIGRSGRSRGFPTEAYVRDRSTPPADSQGQSGSHPEDDGEDPEDSPRPIDPGRLRSPGPGERQRRPGGGDQFPDARADQEETVKRVAKSGAAKALDLEEPDLQEHIQGRADEDRQTGDDARLS